MRSNYVFMIKNTNGYQVHARSLNVGMMEFIIRNHCEGYHVMCVSAGYMLILM